MLIVVAALLALLSPLVALRAPGALLRDWRAAPLAWCALALQVLVIEVGVVAWLAPVLHVTSYVLAAVFLWANRASRPLWLLSAGAACNGVTILLNGGVLPSSAAASAAAGFEPDVAFLNSAVLVDPVLPWLGDVFAWPAPMPLANTFSIGDVLVVAGVVALAWSGSRPLRQLSSPAQQTHPSAA